MSDMLGELAPAIVGLAAAAIGLLYARHLRLGASRARQARIEVARPAE